MNVVDITIVGQKGAGKTQMAKRLFQITPRAIVWDQLEDYENGAIFTSLREAVDFLREHRDTDFHIVFRNPFNMDENLALMRLAYEMQAHEDLPPIGLFFEEASFYSSSHTVPQIVDMISTKGRHFGINVVNVAQRDTQINPILRANAGVIISMRQKKLSADMRDLFTNEELNQIQNLKSLTPLERPKSGVHYLTDPPDIDPFRVWAASVLGDTAPDRLTGGQPLPIL